MILDESMENKTRKNRIFTDKEIENFVGLFEILKRIHIRLVNEGYTIENDNIIPPKDKDAGRERLRVR